MTREQVEGLECPEVGRGYTFEDGYEDSLGGPWRRGMAGECDTIDCPVCKGEKCLDFSRSGYNGHIHAACRTEGCVSWME